MGFIIPHFSQSAVSGLLIPGLTMSRIQVGVCGGWGLESDALCC